MVNHSGANLQILSFAVRFSAILFLHRFADSIFIDPKDRPEVLVNFHSGTTNDKNGYVSGFIHPEYYLKFDNDFFNLKSVKGLQSQLTSFSNNPRENGKVLFRCRKRFTIRGRVCDDDVWLEGKVLKSDGSHAEILAANCDRFRSGTTFMVVKEHVKDLRVIDFETTNFSGNVMNDICRNDKKPRSVLFQLQPECRFFKFRLAYPRQSFVRVTANHGKEQSIWMRTDVIFELPSVIPNKTPQMTDLHSEMTALIRRGRYWKLGKIAVVEAGNETKPRIVEINDKPGKKTKGVKLEDVRIVRGKVMNLCESLLNDQTTVLPTAESTLETNTTETLPLRNNHRGPEIILGAIFGIIIFIVASVSFILIYKRSRPVKTERSAQYEEIDLPSIQFNRESWREGKTALPSENIAMEDNPYESIEAVKAKYLKADVPERSDSYTEIQREDLQETSEDEGRYDATKISLQPEYRAPLDLKTTGEYVVYDTSQRFDENDAEVKY